MPARRQASHEDAIEQPLKAAALLRGEFYRSFQFLGLPLSKMPEIGHIVGERHISERKPALCMLVETCCSQRRFCF
jgi:hypothetical protein